MCFWYKATGPGCPGNHPTAKNDFEYPISFLPLLRVGVRGVGHSAQLLGFWGKVLLCGQGWLELGIFLPLSTECWNCSDVLLHLGYFGVFKEHCKTLHVLILNCPLALNPVSEAACGWRSCGYALSCTLVSISFCLLLLLFGFDLEMCILLTVFLQGLIVLLHITWPLLLGL